ncbi:MAG TPA: hypothetical protein PK878_14150 [bacterium]|nr:hypothetical protein [Candidatus Omnitrophota bacterium]HOJ61421.1 hypothetical protein [bacterium]HOL93008.1 hypothetical protein [bacterium]HPO99255.1 hypothetical protein [bacterium]HXK93101.1 hypothetical protein [bacterium]
MSDNRYPWYEVVSGDEILQGDIIENCPVFLPPSDLDVTTQNDTVDFIWEERDVIVMSQSCDLVKSVPNRIDEVMLCGISFPHEFGEKGLKKDEMEAIRKGHRPAYHILNQCSLPEFICEHRIVDFRKVYSLPLDYFRELAKRKSPRLRLLPPYREHLAQAFARYFMRVGLPVDIPSFTK